MTPEEMRLELKPFDPEAAVDVAKAFLREHGDIPEDIYQELYLVQHKPGDMIDRLDALRAKHFRSQGKEPPPYSGMLE